MTPTAAARLRGLAWAAAPLAAYLFVLQRLWFDAPVWDDYDAILDSAMRLMEASSWRDRFMLLVQQHNEHRIAVMRLVAWSMAEAFGALDFRTLVVIGNLTLVGIFVLAWLEFRDAVAPPLVGAAALLMFQWSYYEASLMGSAALPNIGVVFFSLASLYFALRGGVGGAIACVAFALLATGSQANGLFALPIAAAGCALAGRKRRAWAFAAVAAVLWVAYFTAYARPPGHPSAFAALARPLDALHLFFVVVGGIASRGSVIVGAVLLAAIAWLVSRRFWRAHPTAALWIAFVLISAAAATVGRAGFGVFHASRYAIYSTCLLVVAFLCVCALTRPWSRAATLAAPALALVLSVAASWISWDKAREYALRGHLLAEAWPRAPGVAAERYFGILHPNVAHGARILDAAQGRGLYSPPRQAIHPTRVSAAAEIPPTSRLAGHVDDVRVEGSRLTVTGWTDVPATAPGRTLAVYSREPAGPTVARVTVVPRTGVATHFLEARLVFSGFLLVADYPSEEAARRAAATLCIVAEAPGASTAVLGRKSVSCPPVP